MKAVAFYAHGDSSVLKPADLPEPKMGANGVMVRVKAVGLNHLDIFVRQGWPGLKLSLPHVLGADIAGVVERVGAEVTDLKPGEEVVVNPGLSCGHCERCLRGEDNLCRSFQIVGEHTWGGYAEFAVLPRQNILPKPKNLSFEQAACVPLTFLTSWTMLMRRAQLQPGETVLVHAAGSGVGSAAVQIAKLVGATVIATASTAEKLKKAQELGADHLINYSEKDFLDEVKRITNRRMVDVVFEHVGAATFEKSVACLPYGGRLVTCGATTGHQVQLDLRVLFYKRISLLGTTMGSKGDLFRILQLVERGELKPVLDRVLPLEKAAEAHRLLESRANFGNIVLTP
ncbi:MAG TPA: zinc-binding dehydrogenase [Myxococcaceae bacterium]|nr:zinc-binding dehydrogenase [Myxococcaceae bacterium]